MATPPLQIHHTEGDNAPRCCDQHRQAFFELMLEQFKVAYHVARVDRESAECQS